MVDLPSAAIDPSHIGIDVGSFLVYTGSAIATTAIGTLIPILSGTPALLLYRGVLGARDRAALAFFTSTQLPLVLAITTVAVAGGHMRASTAAALVGAAVLSTLIYPIMGLRLRRGVGEVQREVAT
jgi:hypothetical protein